MLTTLHFLSEPSAQDVRSSNRPFGTDQEPSAQDARSSNHLTLIKEPSVQDVRSTTLLFNKLLTHLSTYQFNLIIFSIQYYIHYLINNQLFISNKQIRHCIISVFSLVSVFSTMPENRGCFYLCRSTSIQPSRRRSIAASLLAEGAASLLAAGASIGRNQRVNLTTHVLSKSQNIMCQLQRAHRSNEVAKRVCWYIRIYFVMCCVRNLFTVSVSALQQNRNGRYIFWPLLYFAML